MLTINFVIIISQVYVHRLELSEIQSKRHFKSRIIGILKKITKCEKYNNKFRKINNMKVCSHSATKNGSLLKRYDSGLFSNIGLSSSEIPMVCV